MEEIIESVSREALIAELTPSKKLANTNKGHNELFVVTWHDSPAVVTEIGRLRELAFRLGGGSTGKSIDLDEYDKMDNPYKQLVVWDPDEKAIVGGFRFFFGNEAVMDEEGQPILASAHQFSFSKVFIEDYLPNVMEVGRLYVAPEYQSTKAGAKSIFSMDNVWDGIVAVIMSNPHILYFLGKATIYPTYDKISRDLIYHYLWKHFKDDQELIRPWKEVDVRPESTEGLMDLVLHSDDVREDLRLLKNAIRMRGTNIPPNIHSFISVTPHLYMCGTAVNHPMHDIEDTALLIPFDDIYNDKKTRHVGAFLRDRKRRRRIDINAEIENLLVEQWLRRRANYVRRLLKKKNQA